MSLLQTKTQFARVTRAGEFTAQRAAQRGGSLLRHAKVERIGAAPFAEAVLSEGRDLKASKWRQRRQSRRENAELVAGLGLAQPMIVT